MPVGLNFFKGSLMMKPLVCYLRLFFRQTPVMLFSASVCRIKVSPSCRYGFPFSTHFFCHFFSMS